LIGRISFIVAIISILLASQSFATELTREEFLKQILEQMEEDYKSEISTLAGIEILSISEVDPSDKDSDLNIFGRNQKDKLNNVPGFIEKPLYSAWTKLLNYGIDKFGFREWANYYSTYTRVEINFDIEESPTGISDTDKGIAVKTDVVNFSLPQYRHTKLGIRLEPKGIDSIDRLANIDFTLKRESGKSKYEIRYSTFDGIKLLASADNFNFFDKDISFSGEYKDSYKELNLSISININEDWRIKIRTTDYLDTGEQGVFIMLFTPIKF